MFTWFRNLFTPTTPDPIDHMLFVIDWHASRAVR